MLQAKQMWHFHQCLAAEQDKNLIWAKVVVVDTLHWPRDTANNRDGKKQPSIGVEQAL